MLYSLRLNRRSRPWPPRARPREDDAFYNPLPAPSDLLTHQSLRLAKVTLHLSEVLVKVEVMIAKISSMAENAARSSSHSRESTFHTAYVQVWITSSAPSEICRLIRDAICPLPSRYSDKNHSPIVRLLMKVLELFRKALGAVQFMKPTGSDPKVLQRFNESLIELCEANKFLHDVCDYDIMGRFYLASRRVHHMQRRFDDELTNMQSRESISSREAVPAVEVHVAEVHKKQWLERYDDEVPELNVAVRRLLQYFNHRVAEVQVEVPLKRRLLRSCHEALVMVVFTEQQWDGGHNHKVPAGIFSLQFPQDCTMPSLYSRSDYRAELSKKYPLHQCLQILESTLKVLETYNPFPSSPSNKQTELIWETASRATERWEQSASTSVISRLLDALYDLNSRDRRLLDWQMLFQGITLCAKKMASLTGRKLETHNAHFEPTSKWSIPSPAEAVAPPDAPTAYIDDNTPTLPTPVPESDQATPETPPQHTSDPKESEPAPEPITEPRRPEGRTGNPSFELMNSAQGVTITSSEINQVAGDQHIQRQVIQTTIVKLPSAPFSVLYASVLNPVFWRQPTIEPSFRTEVLRKLLSILQEMSGSIPPALAGAGGALIALMLYERSAVSMGQQMLIE
ncbi:hypothetical protein ONZ45_g15589 [Pleurotus djamor]|nr:hypothetical protein ONZ45_g15589 [Pleurotus djamor]